ncbi:MAG TPA: hypothetical protein VGO62_16955 [Myxococcota bacterium]
MSARVLVVVVVAGALASFGAHAQNNDFRFLCNGIDANGNTPPPDGCACNANGSNAARWQPAQVQYSYDTGTRPSDVSSSRWSNEIAEARSAWMSVSSLTLSDSGQQAIRQFGSEDGSNSIYWITSSSQWNSQVGADSINSALGVTISLNDRCHDLSMLDADTVMNGTGAFQWHDDSSLGTLTHEMGHGLGLGHPCVECGQLMSAASGGGPSGCGDNPAICFDPTGPQAGDIEGITELYPSPGSIGSTCTSSCNAGLTCKTVAGSSFCTETCTVGGTTCPNGMVCSAVSGQGSICVFTSAPIAQPGDACNPPGCADACAFGTNGVPEVAPGCNVCLDGGGASNQCFAGCNTSTGAGCDAGATCEALTGAGSNAGVCAPGGTALKGQACDENTGCVTGLECVLETATSGFCRASCDGGTGVGCDNTENCLAVFSDGSAACFPHGNVGDGGACTSGSTDECGRGLLCLQDNLCHGICSQGYQCPSSDDVCEASTGSNLSICVGGGGEGEGEGEGGVGEGEGEGEGEGGGPLGPGECHITRGNFDCPDASSACVVANNNDLIGHCTGQAGDVKTFGSCKTDDECTTGLCEDGVCTRPCDIGACPAGYECDAGAAPAGSATGEPGICVPKSCQADHTVCSTGDGFQCVYNETEHYVCAKDGAPVCSCAVASTSSLPWTGVVGAGALALVVVPRRRRRVQRAYTV